jgi:hypothetical protein
LKQVFGIRDRVGISVAEALDAGLLIVEQLQKEPLSLRMIHATFA